MPVLSNDSIQSPAIFNVLAQKPEKSLFQIFKNCVFSNQIFRPPQQW